jgi:hypothetical protein
MKRISIFLVFFALCSVASADSRSWPPGAYSILSSDGTTFFRFIPKLEGRNVVATRVLSFAFDKEALRFDLKLDCEIQGFWEPNFAFHAKDPSVLIFILCRPDTALVVVDTKSKKVIASKTFRELVPEFLDYRDRSTSTLQWCRHPYSTAEKLYIPGGILRSEDDDQGPAFIVDLTTYEITRRKE